MHHRALITAFFVSCISYAPHLQAPTQPLEANLWQRIKKSSIGRWVGDHPVVCTAVPLMAAALGGGWWLHQEHTKRCDNLTKEFDDRQKAFDDHNIAAQRAWNKKYTDLETAYNEAQKKVAIAYDKSVAEHTTALKKHEQMMALNLQSERTAYHSALDKLASSIQTTLETHEQKLKAQLDQHQTAAAQEQKERQQTLTHTLGHLTHEVDNKLNAAVVRLEDAFRQYCAELPDNAAFMQKLAGQASASLSADPSFISTAAEKIVAQANCLTKICNALCLNKAGLKNMFNAYNKLAVAQMTELGENAKNSMTRRTSNILVAGTTGIEDALKKCQRTLAEFGKRVTDMEEQLSQPQAAQAPPARTATPLPVAPTPAEGPQ